MIDLAMVYTNVANTFPNVTAQNATGAGLTDGTEFIKAGLDNGPEFGFMQSMMAYGAGGTNAPTGTMGVPNGVSDGEGVNQIIESMQRGFAVGPGKYVQWGLFDDPSVTLDRVLLLSNQGVLIASFPDLVTETYVGDGNNATAPFFYKSVLADGMTRNTAGPFFILPNGNLTDETVYYKDEKSSGTSGGIFTSGAWQTRDLQTTTGEVLGASLATNQFTLPLGEYSIEASAPAHQVNQHKAKLFNITDASDEIVGSSERSVTGDGVVSKSIIKGTFTISAEKTFEIQHRSSTTAGASGFGQSSGFSVVEVYTQVKITKLDSYPQGITY